MLEEADVEERGGELLGGPRHLDVTWGDGALL